MTSGFFIIVGIFLTEPTSSNVDQVEDWSVAHAVFPKEIVAGEQNRYTSKQACDQQLIRRLDYDYFSNFRVSGDEDGIYITSATQVPDTHIRETYTCIEVG